VVPERPVIDAHVHLIDPWLPGAPPLDRVWSAADFIARTRSIELKWFVCIEADVRADERMAEGRWIAELAGQEPCIAGMVAAVAVERGAAIEPDLDRLQGTGILSGVRRLIRSEPDPRFCMRPDFLEGLRLLGDRGIPFDICCTQDQLACVAEMVRACPDTCFVLDHMGKPTVRHGDFDLWRADLDRLAASRNVVCKISGLATEARHDAWSSEQFLLYIRHAAGAFGDARILFGSDWPISTLAIDYDDWIRIVDEALADLAADALDRFWSGTARRIYRLGGVEP